MSFLGVMILVMGKEKRLYSFDSRVRYSELAENGKLSPDGIVNYLQDCTCFESEELGVGMDTVYGRQKMWVLNFWQIVIDRYPDMGEHIKIATQACGSEKMFGYRNFLIYGEDGKAAVQAYSIWTLLDRVKMRPCMVSPEDIDLYGIADPLPLEKVSRKIPVPKEGGQEQKAFVVQEYHLDTNHHVNNGQYVRMATAYLPETFVIRELRVEYRSQAMLGDTIRPVRYEMPDGYLVALQDSAGKAYCVVRFMG